MKASKKSKIKGAPFYKVGNAVEAIKEETGAWHNALIFEISPGPGCECLDECQCTYKVLFEGSEDSEEVTADRKLNEIRQISYKSHRWEDLKVGMKVVINYNIKAPKQWGYWYDYIIDDVQKRNDVYFVKGTLLVGYDGSSQKISVCIDSDNVADVLEIRPHETLDENQMDSYNEIVMKPEYCAKCKNKPKVKCRTCCCCKCGMKKDLELTIQCDECSNWYHIYCTNPPIKELPKDDWYCPNCNNETRRTVLQKKLMLKKKKEPASRKRSSKESKPSLRTPSSSTVKSPKARNIDQKAEKPKHQEEDVEVEEITRKLPKDSKIWNEIKELFPEYELVRVRADMVKKKEPLGVLSSAAEEFINKDVVNQQLWQEARKHIPEGKQAFLEAVKRLFTCAICYELLNDPITLSCGHNFCIDCFFRSLSLDLYNCCLCRVDIIHTQNYVVNENLSGALSLLFGKKK